MKKVLTTDILKQIEAQTSIFNVHQSLVLCRFQDILGIIHEYFNSEIDWCDYDNGDSSYQRDGYFDPKIYKKYIFYDGNFTYNGDDDMSIIDKNGNTLQLLLAFPTRWLFEDFYQELDEGRKLFLERKSLKKKKNKDNRILRKEKRINMCNSLKKKLTDDEINFIITKFSNEEKRILKGG